MGSVPTCGCARKAKWHYFSRHFTRQYCIEYPLLAHLMVVPKTQKPLSPLTYAIAAHIRAAMVSRQPAWNQLDLERASGIPQSTLSRILEPKQAANTDQLDSICRALGISMGALIDSSRQVVAEREARRLRERLDDPENPPQRASAL